MEKQKKTSAKQLTLGKKLFPNIPVEIEDSVLLDMELGILIIADVKRNNPFTKSYEALLKKMGHISGSKVVTVSTFNEYLKKFKKTNEILQTATIKDAISLFEEASKANASDIHIRIYKDSADILFRINGGLVKRHQWMAHTAKSLCGTIYRSMCDIAETDYIPTAYQDGRIGDEGSLPATIHAIRIASGPHDQGSFMVLRLLYTGETKNTGNYEQRLSGLGYSKSLGHINGIKFMRKRPTGLNIISGPTGSGKSTTLKHLMESIVQERPDLHVLTVEDPPEYPMQNIIQMPVVAPNHSGTDARSIAFGDAIRAAMRFDPDIIMIGEIRDASTARLALRAAMTGHQVWTTLHANSAFNIINRMIDILDIQNPMSVLADITILTGLVFQRLVKTLCPHCKKPLLENKALVSPGVFNRLQAVVSFEQFKDSLFIKGDGCEHCIGTGVSGRTVLAEIVNPDPMLLNILRAKGVNEARLHWIKAQKGNTIIDHAVKKITQGFVDPTMAEDAVGPLTTEIAFQDQILNDKEIYELSK